MRYALISTLMLICGCMPFRDELTPPVKLCQVWVVDHDRNIVTCVSRDEFNRYWRPALIPE